MYASCYSIRHLAICRGAPRLGAFRRSVGAIGHGAFQRAVPHLVLVSSRCWHCCLLGVAGLTGHAAAPAATASTAASASTAAVVGTGSCPQHRRRCLVDARVRPGGWATCRRRPLRPVGTPRHERHPAGGQRRDSVGRRGGRPPSAPCRGPITGRPRPRHRSPALRPRRPMRWRSLSSPPSTWVAPRRIIPLSAAGRLALSSARAPPPQPRPP